MKTKKCMMIEDADGHKYFTLMKHYRQLIEYANKLNAGIYVVTIDEANLPPLLDLVNLAKALTNQDYKADVAYTVIETKIKKSNRKAKPETAVNSKARKAATIRNYVREQFLGQKQVSANDVAYNFKTYGFGLATYKSHILAVRKELTTKGYNVVKTTPGCWSIVNKPKKRPLSVMESLREKKKLGRKLNSHKDKQRPDEYRSRRTPFSDNPY